MIRNILEFQKETGLDLKKIGVINARIIDSSYCEQCTAFSAFIIQLYNYCQFGEICSDMWNSELDNDYAIRIGLIVKSKIERKDFKDLTDKEILRLCSKTVANKIILVIRHINGDGSKTLDDIIGKTKSSAKEEELEKTINELRTKNMDLQIKLKEAEECISIMSKNQIILEKKKQELLNALGVIDRLVDIKTKIEEI